MSAKTATYVLIRHATTHFTGSRLLGRDKHAGLSPHGEEEARSVAQRLRNVPLSVLYTSPILRAVQTAAEIQRALAVRTEIAEAFTELDFGEWTGQEFSSLAGNTVWQRFNAFRSSTRIPRGEHVLEVQRRAVDQLEAWRLQHSGETVGIVTHADVIRALLAHYLGAPVDLMLRIRIDPASISVLSLHEWGPEVSLINGGGPL